MDTANFSIFKKITFCSAIAFNLIGCAKVSDYQNECENSHPELSDVANCLDAKIRNDPRMSSSSSPKLYVLAAKLLGQGVKSGRISDAQARFQLQDFYVKLQRQESYDQSVREKDIQQSLMNYQYLSTMQSIQQKADQPTYTPIYPMNTTTDCYTYGGHTTCKSH